MKRILSPILAYGSSGTSPTLADTHGSSSLLLIVVTVRLNACQKSKNPLDEYADTVSIPGVELGTCYMLLL